MDDDIDKRESKSSDSKDSHVMNDSDDSYSKQKNNEININRSDTWFNENGLATNNNNQTDNIGQNSPTFDINICVSANNNQCLENDYDKMKGNIDNYNNSFDMSINHKINSNNNSVNISINNDNSFDEKINNKNNSFDDIISGNYVNNFDQNSLTDISFSNNIVINSPTYYDDNPYNNDSQNYHTGRYFSSTDCHHFDHLYTTEVNDTSYNNDGFSLDDLFVESKQNNLNNRPDNNMINYNNISYNNIHNCKDDSILTNIKFPGINIYNENNGPNIYMSRDIDRSISEEDCKDGDPFFEDESLHITGTIFDLEFDEEEFPIDKLDKEFQMGRKKRTNKINNNKGDKNRNTKGDIKRGLKRSNKISDHKRSTKRISEKGNRWNKIGKMNGNKKENTRTKRINHSDFTPISKKRKFNTINDYFKNSSNDMNSIYTQKQQKNEKYHKISKRKLRNSRICSKKGMETENAYFFNNKITNYFYWDEYCKKNNNYMYNAIMQNITEQNYCKIDNNPEINKQININDFKEKEVENINTERIRDAYNSSNQIFSDIEDCNYSRDDQKIENNVSSEGENDSILSDSQQKYTSFPSQRQFHNYIDEFNYINNLKNYREIFGDQGDQHKELQYLISISNGYFPLMKNNDFIANNKESANGSIKYDDNTSLRAFIQNIKYLANNIGNANRNDVKKITNTNNDNTIINNTHDNEQNININKTNLKNYKQDIIFENKNKVKNIYNKINNSSVDNNNNNNNNNNNIINDGNIDNNINNDFIINTTRQKCVQCKYGFDINEFNVTSNGKREKYCVTCGKRKELKTIYDNITNLKKSTKSGSAQINYKSLAIIFKKINKLIDDNFANYIKNRSEVNLLATNVITNSGDQNHISQYCNKINQAIVESGIKLINNYNCGSKAVKQEKNIDIFKRKTNKPQYSLIYQQCMNCEVNKQLRFFPFRNKQDKYCFCIICQCIERKRYYLLISESITHAKKNQKMIGHYIVPQTASI